MTPKQRSRARAVQAIYQWLVSGENIKKIEQQFLNQKEGKISKAFFSNLIINITKNIIVLDEIVQPSIDRDIGELGPTAVSYTHLRAHET